MALLGTLACGRIGFDDRADGSTTDADCRGQPFGAPTPVPAIHVDGFDDWGGSPTQDGTELYFHSYRPAALGGNNIFVARGTAPDQYATPVLVAELSSEGDEFQPAVSGDGLDLIFSADRGDPYLLELYEARRTSRQAAWSTPVRITELGGDTMHELDPWLAADGLTLYYAIGPDLTSASLWRATRPSREAPWNAPTPVPIAGAGAFAVSPTLSADELEIFFATDLDTPGDLDVVTATRTDRGAAFGPLERVATFNTQGDEAALHLSVDGRYLYLVQSSDYATGGNSVIVVAERACD